VSATIATGGRRGGVSATIPTGGRRGGVSATVATGARCAGPSKATGEVSTVAASAAPEFMKTTVNAMMEARISVFSPSKQIS
jgi:hypothetical protein